MARLWHGHHAQHGHALDLVIVGQPAVFDAMAGIGPVNRPLGLGDGIKDDGDGIRRLGVRGRLEPGRMRATHHRGIGRGLVVELAVLFRVTGVAIREPRRAGPQRAVGIELDARDGQLVVAEIVG